MNLALLVEVCNARGGGTARSVVHIARELTARGHQVQLFVARAIDHGDLDGLVIRECEAASLKSPLGLARFSRWSRQVLGNHPCDVSVSFTTLAPAMVVQPSSGTVREAFKRRAVLERSSYVQRLKCRLLALGPKGRLLLAAERRTFRDPLIQRFVAASSYVVDQLRRHYQIRPDRIDLNHAAVKIPAVSDPLRDQWRRRVRGGFNVPDDAVVYLFAAHDARFTGIEPLLRACQRLSERNLHFTLLLAGENSYGAQRLAEELRIREKVRFIGTTNQMIQLYCAADVTCVPTYFDAANRVVLESLIMGIPAISTAYSGVGSWIVPESGPPRGRVVADPDDTTALAQAMAELADSAQRQRCATATAGLADQLSLTRHVDGLEEILHRVVASR